MSAPPTVTNSGEDIILATTTVLPESFSDSLAFESAYEIESTLLEIEKGDYKIVSSLVAMRCDAQADRVHSQIALQFPDELLHDSVPVFRLIRERLPAHKELYILADTTYGR